MPAKDLGAKHVCFKCSTKFYDLKKPDPLCPKCGADQRDAAAAKPAEPRRGRSAAPKVVAPVEPAEEASGSDLEEDLDSLGDDVEEEDVSADEDEDI